MIKFFHKNEIMVVFTILTTMFCQTFFKAYFAELDSFTKNKSDTIYRIELQKQQDAYTVHFIKNYAMEFLEKVSPNSKNAEKFVKMINENEYGTEYVNGLNGELYGVVNDTSLEELYPEISFALKLDSEFEKISKKYPGVNNIYYSSKNGFIYKWPKTTTSKISSSLVDSVVDFAGNNDSNVQKVERFGEKNIKVGVNIFDKMNNYYGIVAYEYSNKDVYGFLDNGYRTIISNDNGEIIYTNIEGYTEKGLQFETEKISTSSYEQAQNKDELFFEDNKYYYAYNFTDGTKFLQYIEVKDIFIKSIKESFPIVLTAIVYMVFLFFQINMEKTSNKLSKTIVDLDKSHKELEKIANTDFLTGVYNRGGFTKLVTSYVNENKNMTFVMADIDKFKSINDKYGHDIGDVVLKEVSKTIKNSLIGQDEIGRWGGEEFLIVYTGLSEDEAFERTEEIRKKILEIRVETPEKIIVTASASFGLSRHLSNKDPLHTISEADEALYYSKNNGRNRVTRYSALTKQE